MTISILTIILTSAVISGIVTTVLSHLFENKRYVRDKKFSIYSNFLKQLNNLIPTDQQISRYQGGVLQHLTSELHKLQENLWQVKIIGSEKVKKYAESVFWLFQELVKRTQNQYQVGEGKNLNELSSTDRRKWLADQFVDIKENRDEMVEAMSKDFVSRWRRWKNPKK